MEEKQILENILENQDDKLTETNQLLENLLEKSDEDNLTPLLEANLEMQDEISGKIGEGSDKVSEAIKELKPAMNAAGFIQNFMEAIKGDKGEKGDSPIKGKDYYTQEEIAEVVKQITDDIRIPEDGKTPEKGKDYFTEDEIKSVVDEVFAMIPSPKDGKDGRDGLDGMDGENAVVDYEVIVSKVLAKLPKIKEKEEVTAKKILKMIKGSLSYKDLKDLPDIIRQKGGIGYLRELADIELTNLANDETLKWDAVKQKWVNSANGSGDVSSSSNIADNAIVRGDGGAKGVQESLVTISDTGVINIGANNTFITEKDNAGTGTINIIKVNTSDKLETGTDLYMGSFQMVDASAGVHTLTMQTDGSILIS